MEEQEELKTQIGTQEVVSLKPMNLKIENVEVVEVGIKKAKKVVCFVKHPDNPEQIQISQIKWENKGKLDLSGLWFNLDKDKLIRKGSALATFLTINGCKAIEQLKGKEIPTVLDDKGYLCWKCY